MLIAVDKKYFTSRLLYVKHIRWLELWKSCRQNDNISQVNIKKADTNSFKELSKYEAKDFEMLSYSQEVFEYFHNALHGRKTLTYNGCFHIGKKKFQNGELDSFKETDPVEYVDTSFHSYELDISRYKLVKERQLSKNEHLKFNNMKIMDEEILED
jgi:rep